MVTNGIVVGGGDFIDQSRGLGPNVTPPPRQIGERFEPARARPVPFCRQGLAPLPDTSARVFVLAEPVRRPARKAMT